MRHLLSVEELSADEIRRIFSLSEDLKAKYLEGTREPLLPGRVMALLFEKQSLRTRVSFQAGMTHLGGSSMMLGEDAGFGKRESVADFVRVLSEMVDVIVVRSKSHATVEDVANHSACSVINGLTDRSHPCQALADLFTLEEVFGDLAGRKLAWVGDANNVARSLIYACGRLGVSIAVAAPKAYHFDPADIEQMHSACSDLSLLVTDDPQEAVDGASAIYTDVWASMGQEKEQTQRRRDFTAFQVNAKLLQAAPDDVRFMHCLPAKRGEEVTDDVIDSPQSVVVQQAANRMHVQKGILVWLLATRP